MEWFYFIVFELVVTSAFGFAGTYFLWLIKKRKIAYGSLLNKYGYLIGGVGALVTTLIWLSAF